MFTFYCCANRPWEVFQVLLFPLRDLWRHINSGTDIDIPSFVNSLHLLLSRLLNVCGWKDSGWRLQGFPSTWPSWEESYGFKNCVCRPLCRAQRDVSKLLVFFVLFFCFPPPPPSSDISDANKSTVIRLLPGGSLQSLDLTQASIDPLALT